MIYFIFLLFLLVVAGLGAITYFNLSNTVHLTMLSWQTPDLPVGLWLIAAFLLGALLLYLVAVSSATGDRRELKQLHARVDKLKAEKEELQTALEAASSARVASSPLPQSGTFSTGPLGRTASGSLASAPFIPMPGISNPSHNTNSLPSQDFRQ